MARRHATLLAFSGVLSVAGCNCHDAKPYTPYKLGDRPETSSSAAAAPVAANSADGGEGFVSVQGVAPPGDGKSWSLGSDLAVLAPVGRTFGVGLVVDVDLDQKPDLLAWARSPDGLRGEIVFASAAAPGDVKTVAALPNNLAPAGCTAKTALTLFGPRSLAFEFRPTCPAELRERAIRWVALVRIPQKGDDRADGPELGLELRLGATLEGEALQVGFDGRDRDGDGRTDATVTLTLSGAPRPLASGAASASVVFFDRPAGLSRDPTEPGASFTTAIAGIMSDGRKRSTAPKVAAAAHALRRLWSLLCEEGGRALVTTSAGPIQCGSARPEADTPLAEVEAALNLGEPVTAFAALARLDAAGTSAPRKKDIERLLKKPIPSLAIASTRALTAAPSPGEKPPVYGPLAFVANGDLLIRTLTGVVRAEKGSLAESPSDPRSWPQKIGYPVSAPVHRLLRVEQRCGDAPLVAHFEVRREGASPTIEIPLPIPSPPRCTPEAALPSFPIGTNARGVLFTVGANVLQVPFADPPTVIQPDSLLAEPLPEEHLGSARSPDGMTFALPTPRGVLVVTAEGTSRRGKARLWTGSDLEKSSFCVPESGAKRIACVRGTSAFVAEAP